MATEVADDLRALGIRADHVDGLNMKGASDPDVFATALRLGCDAVVTKDRYRQESERLASLRAMLGGLRIVRLVFRTDSPARASAEAELRLIRAHLDDLQRAFEPLASERLLVLNAHEDRVTRVQSLDEVAAELRTLEKRLAARRARNGGGELRGTGDMRVRD